MKRLIAMLLCFVMVAAPVCASAIEQEIISNPSNPRITHTESDYVLGDATDDGDINAKDDLAIKLKCAKLGDINVNNADIINDGKISARDLLALKRYLTGDPEWDLAQYEPAKDGLGFFTIAGNDISEYCIVYTDANDYEENIYLAADTLRKYIEIATGVELEMDTEATAERKIEFVDVTQYPALEKELGVENYKWEVVDGNVYIYGTRRGNLYVVWEILEEYLGYRFYFENETYQYDQRWADIPEGTSVFHRPYLVFRQARQTGDSDPLLHKFPMRMNSTQCFHWTFYGEAYGTLTGPHFINAHSYDYYWRMATGQVDVEYTGTNGNDYGAKYAVGIQHDAAKWNPCFTSDEAYETLFRGLLETIRYCTQWENENGVPPHVFREETSAMSFSICDNRTVCSCTECKYIMADGTTGRGENKKERLNAGEAGLNLYMANRAARDIVKYYEGRPAGTAAEGYDSNGERAGYGAPIYDEYPGLKIYSIFYDHTPPSENLLTDPRYEALVPAENLIIVWCGNPCNNHAMGANECNGNVNILGNSGEASSDAMKKWGEVFHTCGAQMWFWYYPVNYNTQMTDSPNILVMYYDFVYMITECYIDGIFYEGGGQEYIFQILKEHLAMKFMWSVEYDADGNMTYMSYDQYLEDLKEFLLFYYGPGYEEIYQYILMYEEAGNQSGICYVNNCDYPGDMFGYEYVRDNYETMRDLLEAALEKTTRADQKSRIEYLIVTCDFLGLSACHKSWYLEGTEETKALYAERYDYMYNFVKSHRMSLGAGASIDQVEYTLEESPMDSFYNGGTWRADLVDQWTWLGSTPGWGYA